MVTYTSDKNKYDNVSGLAVLFIQKLTIFSVVNVLANQDRIVILG